MNICKVLRCQEAVDAVHVWNPSDYRIEIGVCSQHAARLEAGEERAYQRDDPVHTVVLMGDDLPGTRDEFVDQISVQHGWTITAPDGSPAVQVHLTTRRRGSGQMGFVEFALSEMAAGRMAAMLLGPRGKTTESESA